MGSNCSTCSYFNKSSEKSSEFSLNDDSTSSSYRYLNKDSNEKSDMIDYCQQFIPQIIKIQAFWRGHQDRKLVNFLQKSQETIKNRYFTLEESREISKEKDVVGLERDTRLPYYFQSGAVYTGQ